MEPRFYLDWVSGSSAVVDIQAAGNGATTRYWLRYTSPFRPTMRSPSQELPTGTAEFEQINRDLDAFASRRAVRAQRGGPADAPPPTDGADLAELGRQLFELTLPRLVRSDLRKEGLFIELGTDEDLLHLPWELMHDGDDFICLKHYVGRYVNMRRTPELQARVLPNSGSDLGRLRVLLIAVPRPKPQDGQVFEELPSVEAERDAILTTLGDLGVQAEVLSGPDATGTRVLRALRDTYQIVHFSGHAIFDARAANASAVVLDDRKLSVGRLIVALAEQPAVLCVINACETTRSVAPVPGGPEGALSWQDQYNMYGLARAFLENGAYVLGSRWKLPDVSARRFAEEFYRSFLGNGDPIGRAITVARQAVSQAATSDDFSWASYVYYGDPRLCLRRATDEPPSQLQIPMEDAVLALDTTAVAPEGIVEIKKEIEGETLGLEHPDELLRRRRLRLTLEEAAREYERIRGATPLGEQSTELGKVVATVAALAASEPVGSAESILQRDREGDRAILLALLEAKPDPAHFEFVLDVLRASMSATEEAQALKVAARMLSDLAADQKARLGALLTARATAPELLGTDRLLLISQLRSRLGDSGPGNPDFD